MINNCLKTFLGIKSITHKISANFQSTKFEIMRKYNFKWTKEEKKILFKKKPREHQKLGNYHDPLQIPGYTADQTRIFYYQFISKSNVPISGDNAGLLLYNFTKNNQMTPEIFRHIEIQLKKKKGQFNIRTIFGCLYGCINFGHQKLVSFFIDEFLASEKQFTIFEILQLVEALVQNKSMELEQKHEMFEKYWKSTFTQGLPHVKMRSIKLGIRFFDTFKNFQYYDEEIWNSIFRFLSNKRGFARIPIMERLYEMSGTFPAAKELFDKYYVELSSNENVLKFYNFEELRYYTNGELIKRANESPQQYYPKKFTLASSQQEAEEWSKIYQELLAEGQVKEQKEILLEKTFKFENQIRKRFDSSKNDGRDLTNVDKNEFENLFGDYNEEVFGQLRYASDFEREKEAAEEESSESSDSSDSSDSPDSPDSSEPSEHPESSEQLESSEPSESDEK